MQLRVNPDGPTAAEDAADLLTRRIKRAVRDRDRCDLAVSGGGAIAAHMFAVLADSDLPWDRVHVYQVDERIAPAGDPARNVRMLAVMPLRSRQLHSMPVTRARLAAAVAAYAASLPDRFDIVHLGVGEDGHTASWPPGDPVIDAGSPVAVSASYRGFARMTLTPRVVNAARSRLVLATGLAKAPAIRRWLLDDPHVPVQRVRRTGTTVVLDTDAASELVIDGQ
ncbi:MAG: 6-phosphogluconolactonase [Acidimicrobiia bacterium]